MALNRKEAEAFLYKALDRMDKTGSNSKLYKEFFSKLSDAQFEHYVQRLEKGEDVLAYYAPSIKAKPDLDELLAAAEELGATIFDYVDRWDDATGQYYRTPYKCCILELSVRKQAQFADHKLSVPEGDTKVDILTGQVMKPDRAGSISQVEIQTMFARGLKKSSLELLKYRGGDTVAGAEFRRSLEETGAASVKTETGSVPRSAVTLDALFSGMHIESNASGL